MKPSRGFTLIELLVVIAILGILMALLFPAVQGAIRAAKKATSQNDVVQIATAFTAYQTEYGMWPSNYSGGAQNVGGTVLGNLMGTNTRAIVFLEVNNYKKGKGGLDSSGNFADPWGNAYKYMLDTNYSSSLSVTTGWPSGAGPSPVSLRKSVAVWGQVNYDYTGSSSSRLPAASW